MVCREVWSAGRFTMSDRNPRFSEDAPERVIATAYARGWVRLRPGVQSFQWRGPDGEESPRFDRWLDALGWIRERLSPVLDDE